MKTFLMKPFIFLSIPFYDSLQKSRLEAQRQRGASIVLSRLNNIDLRNNGLQDLSVLYDSADWFLGNRTSVKSNCGKSKLFFFKEVKGV